MSKRIIVVANRLPVTISIEENKVCYKPSPGGLVTALSSLKDAYEQIWIGWPGEVDLSFVDVELVRNDLWEQFRAVPVFLDVRQLNRYYFGFSNRVLWPVFHYLPTHIDYDERDFLVYREVNQLFANKIIEHLKHGSGEDTVWIQDYQLMLVPAMVRAAIPDARIGFFLHTPFPSSEVFRALPYREELLKGLLGSSLIGFHTYSYQRHFRSSLLHILGLDSEIDHLDLETHNAKFGVFPISIDPERIDSILSSDAMKEHTHVVRQITKGRRMIISVDRLDYTKGIPERLRAYKKFLMKNPHMARDVVLVQIAVPSRTRIPDYRHLKDQVEIIVMDLIEAFETDPYPPIHYIYRSLSFERLVAFYHEADVALVTPYFDGMNLVAKEYVAVKKKRGVLILSELAGAASELGEALIINPWNLEQISNALEHALSMPVAEQERRISSMYEKVVRNNVYYWANSFLSELFHLSIHSATHTPESIRITHRLKEELLGRYRNSRSPLLISDYDGTVTEITRIPFSARPDGDLHLLMNKFSASRLDLAIVSARARKDVEDWLGEFNIILSAEHGLWIRWRNEEEWHRMIENNTHSWFDTVKEILNQFNLKTPGSFSEEKEVSISWHYRLSDPTLGRWQARELSMHLNNILANEPVEVINGKAVVEVRTQGIHKGNIISRMEKLDKDYDLIIALGDDATDEYLFASLPENSVSIKVGRGNSRAEYRIDSVHDVRMLMMEFAHEAEKR